jgi:peptide-methionine (S)-S-oxide reductase
VYRSSFLRLEGVHAISGYIGVKQLILPIRKYVMEIGHAEAIEITFDPAKIGSEIFWRSFATHDPTTINRQGMMWERTAVRYFITTRSRKKTAEDYIGLMTAEDTFGKRIEDFAGIKIL